MQRHFKADCEGNRNKWREDKEWLRNTFRLHINFTSLFFYLFLGLISSTCSHKHTRLFLHLIILGDTQKHTQLDSSWRGIGPRPGRYLTTHNTHKRQTCMPKAVIEPAIPAQANGRRSKLLTARLLRSALYPLSLQNNCFTLYTDCIAYELLRILSNVSWAVKNE